MSSSTRRARIAPADLTRLACARARLAGLALVGGLALSACQSAHSAGARKPSEPAAPPSAAPDLGDVLVDARRDLVVRVAPRELVRDPVLGPLFARALERTLEHGRLEGSSGSTLAVVSKAEDLVVAVRDREGRDVVAVASGLPTGTSPTDLKDERGRALFTASGEVARGRVRAFATGGPELRAKLFELPQGVWVVAVGPRTEDVRAALERGVTSYTPKLHRPLAVELAGETLGALRSRAGPQLRPSFVGLAAVALTVAPTASAGAAAAQSSVRATLRYETAEAAERAEPTVRRAVEIMPKALGWTLPVVPRVLREGAEVVVELVLSAPR